VLEEWGRSLRSLWGN